MEGTGGTSIRYALVLLLSCAGGCISFAPPCRVIVHLPRSARTAPSSQPAQIAAAPEPAVQQAAYQEQTTGMEGVSARREEAARPPADSPAGEVCPASDQLPFAGRTELSADALVEQVLARNPTLAQMVAAWKAVQARYPQVTSLDDPLFTTWAAPAAIGQLEDGNRGYRLEASQKYPWFGKLGLRGQNVLAEAGAAGNEVEDTKLQLIESARDAFYEYYLVHRALELNRESLRLLRDFKQNAATRYQTGRGAQQDVLLANVEMGRQRERALLLERMRGVAVARINTLMHLPPDAPLPPPPAQLTVTDDLPDAALLRAAALSRRPDLRAIADRIRAEETALALAYKEFYPDVETMAAYDTFWGLPDRRERAQVGIRLNLPVRLARRNAAIHEAQARIAERRAELARRTDQVNYQVQQAYEQVRESTRAARLYRGEVVPASQTNVQAAQADYITGKIPFLTLIEAERNVIGLQDRYYEIVTDYFRRRAALERAIGGPLTACAVQEQPRSSITD